MKKNIKISLTDFISFMNCSGIRKLPVANRIVHRKEYSPEFDFYRLVRNAIVKATCNNDQKFNLDQYFKAFLVNVNDKKKNHYTKIVGEFSKFLKLNSYSWFKPTAYFWEYKELCVRINPEIGLIMDSKKYAIKLYFKEEKLDKENADLILSIMYAKAITLGVKPAILDVRRRKLHTIESPKNDCLILAQVEAQLLLNLYFEYSNIMAA